ncbi:carbohydrate ABC transporter permease [Saccharopolyspora rhizosphaerae]|uniref:Carbohydrate ABC transporter permease n=1 Tax=Saccharopolyspora rhizosphaerae TaxID=2492662 RepID=A0A426JM84_9PSEU|nr:carbohydrate ABC transporter permease [Saccharopolyspora rhizosphaerae]RRO14160.1 carbohydrate ABC transporter permease [Saccharopolyspora rhizosphaerae]
MNGRFGWGTALLTLATIGLAALWSLPFVWTLLTSLKPESETTEVPLRWLPSEFTTEAYRSVLATDDIWTWLINSVFTASAVTVLVVLLSSMAAYGFSRTEFRGRTALFGVVVAGVLVPTEVLIVPLFQEMVFLGMVDTPWGVILPQVVLPAMVFILKVFFDGVPRELEEAAIVDGASQWRIYWRIVMPLSRPVLAAVAIFTFITTWNNFLWPFIVTADPNSMTLPVGLATVQGSYGVRYAEVMATVVIAGLPLLLLFVLFQRQIVRGIAHTGLAGR